MSPLAATTAHINIEKFFQQFTVYKTKLRHSLSRFRPNTLVKNAARLMKDIGLTENLSRTAKLVTKIWSANVPLENPKGQRLLHHR